VALELAEDAIAVVGLQRQQQPFVSLDPGRGAECGGLPA